MDFITDNLIGQVVTFILGIGVVAAFFSKVGKFIPPVLAVAGAITTLLKAVSDKKITKDEVKEIREDTKEAVDLVAALFEKKHGNYAEEPAK